jgi:hypothetical protein
MNKTTSAKAVKYGLKITSCLIIKIRAKAEDIFEELNHLKNIKS